MRVNPYIPADAISDITAALAPLHDAVCTVQRPSEARDPGGAPLPGVYGTMGVYDCRVVRGGTSAVELVAGGRLTAEASYEVSLLDLDADVRANDRILVDDGTTLEVAGPPNVATHGTVLLIPVTVSS